MIVDRAKIYFHCQNVTVTHRCYDMSQIVLYFLHCILVLILYRPSRDTFDHMKPHRNRQVLSVEPMYP